MKKFSVAFGLTLVAMGAFSTPAHAQITGTVVFDSIPSPTPPNVPSEGFQCCQNAEFGDQITLEGDTPRRLGFVTVLMSSWAMHSDYPEMPAAGYHHPITLNIYLTPEAAATHTPWTSVKLDATIPWRPEANPSCQGTGWKKADKCYNGLAFPLVFDLTKLNIELPDTFIYGVAYDTNTWGYAPLNHPGPYESLNVGLATVPPTVGTDTETGYVYRSSFNGVGGLIAESGWSPYTPAVQFTTLGFAVVSNDCKNGAWQNLVRADYTPFKNQGACVSYVATGK